MENLLVLLGPVAASVLLQVIKGETRNTPWLRWLGAGVGILGGTSAWYLGGQETFGLPFMAALGALLASGTHSLLLHDTALGKTLKALGDVFLARKANGD